MISFITHKMPGMINYKDRNNYCIVEINDTLLNKLTIINSQDMTGIVSPYSVEKNGDEIILYINKLSIVYYSSYLIFIGTEVFQLLINEVISQTPIKIKIHKELILAKMNDKLYLYPLSKSLKNITEVEKVIIDKKVFAISKL